LAHRLIGRNSKVGVMYGLATIHPEPFRRASVLLAEHRSNAGLELNVDVLKSLEEANEVSAVRLVNRRQTAKVGDIFGLPPFSGVFLWAD